MRTALIGRPWVAYGSIVPDREVNKEDAFWGAEGYKVDAHRCFPGMSSMAAGGQVYGFWSDWVKEMRKDCQSLRKRKVGTKGRPAVGEELRR
jgi:hypothetical protein